MGYRGRALIGAGLMLACLGWAGYAVYELAQTGSCASGGPYVSARPCPEHTALYGLSLFPAVIGFLLGGWVFSIRGRMRAIEPGLPPTGSDMKTNARVGRSW